MPAPARGGQSPRRRRRGSASRCRRGPPVSPPARRDGSRDRAPAETGAPHPSSRSGQPLRRLDDEEISRSGVPGGAAAMQAQRPAIEHVQGIGGGRHGGYMARRRPAASSGTLTAARRRADIAAMQSLARPKRVRRAAPALLDLLLPPRCLACGATVSAAGTLCAGVLARHHLPRRAVLRLLRPALRVRAGRSGALRRSACAAPALRPRPRGDAL